MKIILASKSPRRKEILSSLNIPFEIIVSDADENCNISDPARLVCLLSERKGMAVANRTDLLPQNDDYLIISSDTVVSCDNKIFGKPSDLSEAKSMIRSISGKTHSVYSGISVITVSKSREIKTFTDFEETLVTFENMSDDDIELYLSLENVTDKAGAYAIQGAASLWIDKINGNYFNVVGLPVNKLHSLLRKAGFSLKQLINSNFEPKKG